MTAAGPSPVVARGASRRRAGGLAGLAAAIWAATTAIAYAQQPAPPLAQLQFDIVGVRLEVDPPVLTVPKNIATQINTRLVLPPHVGAEGQEALARLADGATVEARLHGPGIPEPVVLSVQPGQPIALPAFALPGDYFLDRIRLIKDGADLGATDKDSNPVSVIPIAVIADILITTVSSRPLTLDEIRTRGVVIDDQNFQALNFQVAFNIEGTPFTLNLPVAVPTRELLMFENDRAKLLKSLAVANAALADSQIVTLPPQFDCPGLNFYIAAAAVRAGGARRRAVVRVRSAARRGARRDSGEHRVPEPASSPSR